MKLFQQMLVVGASLSLLAPISAQASNIVDLEEMNSYSRSKKILRESTATLLLTKLVRVIQVKKNLGDLIVKLSLTKLLKILQTLMDLIKSLRFNKIL